MSKKPDLGLFARGWDDEQLQQQLEHQRERLRRAEALQERAPSSLGTDEIQLFHSLNATQRLVSRLEAEYDDRRTRNSDELSMMLSEALAPGTDLSSAAVERETEISSHIGLVPGRRSGPDPLLAARRIVRVLKISNLSNEQKKRKSELENRAYYT